MQIRFVLFFPAHIGIVCPQEGPPMQMWGKRKLGISERDKGQLTNTKPPSSNSLKLPPCPGCAVMALRWPAKPANLIRFIPA